MRAADLPALRATYRRAVEAEDGQIIEDDDD